MNSITQVASEASTLKKQLSEKAHALKTAEAEVSRLSEAYSEESIKRKKLHNQLEDLKALFALVLYM